MAGMVVVAMEKKNNEHFQPEKMVVTKAELKEDTY